MEIKDIIKKRREELNLTYEQLGNMVGVGKSTVRKWETGLIENMRRDNIVALSKALNISPAIIMGWQTIEDNNKLILSQQETTLLENFNKLNDLGKKEANKRVEELTEISKYIDYSLSACAMAKLDTEEYTLAAHDDGLDEETKKRNLEKAKAMFKQMDEE